MDKLIEFLKILEKKKFYGSIEIKFEAGIVKMITKLKENVKLV